MLEGSLTQINGEDIPPGVTGTPLCGHSALGEDYIFPEVAENAARIGTIAMMKAYAAVGLRPNPFISAVLGAAATLEIIHPDAPAPEKYGPSFKIHTPTLAGMAAVKAAGLPDKIHFRITGEEFDTAKLVGDLGIILKDSGSPTVVGMLAFYEMFGCFAESGRIGTGGSGGPRNSPCGHVFADASLALRTISLTGSIEEAAEVIRRNEEGFVDPEMTAILANTVARKVEELREGPVSKALLLATERQTKSAIESRTREAYEALRRGTKLGEVVQSFEKARISRVEQGTSEIMSKNSGKAIEIKFLKLGGGARRAANMAKKMWILDADIDVVVTIDGEEIVMRSLLHDFIPKAIMQKESNKFEAISVVSPAVGELLTSAHTLIDLEVPALVAVLLGIATPEEAAVEAMRSGPVLSGGLPSSARKVQQVAEIALKSFS